MGTYQYLSFAASQRTPDTQTWSFLGRPTDLLFLPALGSFLDPRGHPTEHLPWLMVLTLNVL